MLDRSPWAFALYIRYTTGWENREKALGREKRESHLNLGLFPKLVDKGEWLLLYDATDPAKVACGLPASSPLLSLLSACGIRSPVVCIGMLLLFGGPGTKKVFLDDLSGVDGWVLDFSVAMLFSIRMSRLKV